MIFIYTLALIQIVWPVLGIIAIVYAAIMLGRETEEMVLKGKRTWLIFVLCFFAPLINQAIFYYGWKKKFPKKAKKANNIGWLAILVLVVLWIAAIAIIGPENLEQMQNEQIQNTATTSPTIPLTNTNEVTTGSTSKS